MKIKTTITIIKLIVIVLLPVILLILPSDFFDQGQSICLSRLLLNQECFACGLTRGIMHLIHFGFEDAWDHNILSFIVLPLLIVIWVEWFFKEKRMLESLVRPGV